LAALTTGPIVFFTDEGAQVEISPDWLSFDGAVLKAALPSGISSPKLLAWLRYLYKRGYISPLPTPPPEAALVVQAATNLVGDYGNKIELTIAPGTIPGRADVTASVTDRYEDLTAGTIKAVLGDSGDPKPGLLQVKSVGADSVPDAGPVTKTGPAGGAPPTWTLSDAAGDVVAVLEPSNAGAPFNKGDVSVVVRDVNDPKFTITVEWTNTVQNVDPNKFGDSGSGGLRDLGFLVAVVGPPPEIGFKEPKPGTIQLSGGRDASAATAAEATLLTND
jgi:hypothetical protein